MKLLLKKYLHKFHLFFNVRKKTADKYIIKINQRMAGDKMSYQCAWCGSFIVNGNRVSESKALNDKLSHGICCKCKLEVEKDYFTKRNLLKAF